MCVPFARFFSAPPSRRSKRAFLIKSWPYIDGASEDDNKLKISERFARWLIVRISLSVGVVCAIPPPTLDDKRFILLARIKDLLKNVSNEASDYKEYFT